MAKLVRVEFREPVEHCGYCEIFDDVVTLTDTLIWLQAVGGQISFAFEGIRCPYSGRCTLSNDCRLTKEAYRQWREEANAKLESIP